MLDWKELLLISPTILHPAWFILLCALAASALPLLLFALSWRRAAERMEEKERIARELYDTLLQGIGGLLLHFQMATERIPRTDPTRELLEEALRQSDGLLQQGRELALGLEVNSTDANDLAQAFAAVGSELRQKYPLDFRVVVNGDPRELHPVVLEEVYRIGREAIANSFQHARAERCETEINYHRTHLRIGFRDDGCGVDATVLEPGIPPNDRGVAGMYGRARKLGADLEVWTRPGLGTEVALRVPATIAYRAGKYAPRRQWFRRLVSGDD
jgi:signal transduction histidine kinase